MTVSGQIVGYRRVSSKGQNLARQTLPNVTGRIFEEKLSGANRDRPALQEMLNYIRQGDEVHVHSIDRLARSLVDLNNLVDEITTKGASIRFLTESLQFKGNGANEDPTSKLMFHMLGAFSEFERTLISKRRQEGIEKAKAEGRYTGRRATIDHDLVGDLLACGIKADQVAKWLSIGVASVFRIRRQTIDECGKLTDPGRMATMLKLFQGHEMASLVSVDTDIELSEIKVKLNMVQAYFDRIKASKRGPAKEIFLKKMSVADHVDNNGLQISNYFDHVPNTEHFHSLVENMAVANESIERYENRQDAVTKVLYRHGPMSFDPKRLEYLSSIGMEQAEIAETMGIPEDAVKALYSVIGPSSPHEI